MKLSDKFINLEKLYLLSQRLSPKQGPHRQEKDLAWARFSDACHQQPSGLKATRFVEKLDLNRYHLASPQLHTVSMPHLSETAPAFELNFCNGYLMSGHLHRSDAAIRFGLLADLTQAEWSFLIPPQLKQGHSWLKDLNNSLNIAGTYLIIPPEVHLKQPIYINHLINAQAEFELANPRVLLLCGDGSQVSILETYHHDGASQQLTNSLLEVQLGKNAVLDHLTVFSGAAPKHAQVHHKEVLLQAHSEYASLTLNLGLQALSLTETMRLLEMGAKAQVLLPEIGQGQQFSEKSILMHHQAPFGMSRIEARALVGGQARSLLDGRILVDPGAHHTSAHFTHKSLNLSERAVVQSKPELEIYNDDVQCSHGSSVGELDAETLFYMRARGLEETQAKQLLIEAFLSPLLQELPLWPLERWVRPLLSELSHG